jgi:hypothetical protein
MLARKFLLARRRGVKRRVLEGSDNGLEAVGRTIEAAQERVAAWQIGVGGDGWDVLEPGLKRVYRDGRTAFKRAQVGEHPELYHEWRKRVKDLWHQTEILEAVWPEMMKPLAEEFHSLADTLGQEHDLSVLEAVLEAEALARAEAPSGVIPALEAKRAGLRAEAARCGAFLFAEKPGTFLKRVAKYWKAWNQPVGDGEEAPSDATAGPPAIGVVDLPIESGHDSGGEAGAAQPVPTAGAA